MPFHLHLLVTILHEESKLFSLSTMTMVIPLVSIFRSFTVYYCFIAGDCRNRLLLGQSVPQDQKSVTFSHSVISHNQLLQNSKITAYIFLTFRNLVKIFLSQNILQNILNVVYRKTLSIRTDRNDKQ